MLYGNEGATYLEASIPGLVQPKRQIAEQLAALGVVGIPTIYEDLADAEAAVGSGTSVIARSENPYELYYSGLAHSPVLNEKSVAQIRKLGQLTEVALQKKDPNAVIYGLENTDFLRRTVLNITQWASSADITGSKDESQLEILGGHSFSYWQLIRGGIKRSVWQNNSDPTLTYIATESIVSAVPDERGKWVEAIDVIKNGELTDRITQYGERLDAEVEPNHKKILALLTDVQASGVVDPHVAHLIEVVSCPDGQELFLQAHPLRPFAPIRKKKPANDMSGGVVLSRGKMSERETIVPIRLGDPFRTLDDLKALKRGEQVAGYDRVAVDSNETSNTYAGANECILRAASLYVDWARGGTNEYLALLASGHISRTGFTQPEVSIILTQEKWEEVYDNRVGNNALLRIKSDRHGTPVSVDAGRRNVVGVRQILDSL